MSTVLKVHEACDQPVLWMEMEAPMKAACAQRGKAILGDD